MGAQTYTRNTIPMKGLYTSAVSDLLTPEYTPWCKNVRFRFGNVQRAPGRSKVMQTLALRNIMDFNTFTDAEGMKSLVMLCASDLTDDAFAVYDDSVFQFGSPVNMGTPAVWNVRFSSTQGEERLFACRASVISALKETSPGVWGVEVLTSPKGCFLEYFNNRVILMRLLTPTDPTGTNQTSVLGASQLQWSKQGDYTDWLVTTGHGGFLELYDGSVEPITGGKVLNDRLAVYRRNSISDIVVTGIDTAPFLPQSRVNGIGCAFPWTLASAGQFHIFVANDFNIYMWDGARLNAIGTPIHSLVRQLIDVDSKDLSMVTDWRSLPFATMFMGFKEYHLAIPSLNGDVTILIYDYLRDSWTRDVISGLSAFYEWQQKLSSDSGNVFELLAYPEIFPTLVAGDNKDYFIIDERIVGDYLQSGSMGGMEMYFDSPDMYYGKEGVTNGTLERIVVSQTPPARLQEASYIVEVSTDRGRTFEAGLPVVPTYAQQGYEFVDFNITSNVRRYRFRYPESSSAAKPSWRAYTDLFIPSGEFFPTKLDIEAPYGIWDETFWDLCLWG